jgi:hypothetical protein
MKFGWTFILGLFFVQMLIKNQMKVWMEYLSKKSSIEFFKGK